MWICSASLSAMYTGIRKAFTRGSSTEARALWRGISSVTTGAGPAHAAHFGAYEIVKELTGGNVVGSRYA